MPTTSYSDLNEEIHIELGMVPDPLVTRALRETAIAFCEASRCYIHRETLAVSAGVSEYTLTVPDQTVLIEIDAMRGERGKLEPTSEALLDQTGLWTSTEGYPTQYFMLSPSSVRLYPIPQGDEQLSITMAVKPTKTSTGLETSLVDRYADYLVGGAVARLASMEGSDWYNPNLAASFAEGYTHGIRKAMLEREGDNLNKRRTVAYGGY